jgi:hypothetical protein
MTTRTNQKRDARPRRLGTQDLEVFLDLRSGTRKDPPRTWGRFNHVVVPDGAWIRGLRRQHELSHHDFGGIVGVQAADVRAWEGGKSAPNGSACRLMGLLSRKPYLVEFMRRPWK